MLWARVRRAFHGYVSNHTRLTNKEKCWLTSRNRAQPYTGIKSRIELRERGRNQAQHAHHPCVLLPEELDAARQEELLE